MIQRFPALFVLAVGFVVHTIPELKQNEALATEDAQEAPVALSGEWVGTAPDGARVTYTFSKQGTINWRFGQARFDREFPQGIDGKYVMRSGKPYHEIDLLEFKEARLKDVVIKGIIEIVDERSFKMELTGPGKSGRPKELSKDAILFKLGK